MIVGVLESSQLNDATKLQSLIVGSPTLVPLSAVRWSKETVSTIGPSGGDGGRGAGSGRGCPRRCLRDVPLPRPRDGRQLELETKPLPRILSSYKGWITMK